MDFRNQNTGLHTLKCHIFCLYFKYLVLSRHVPISHMQHHNSDMFQFTPNHYHGAKNDVGNDEYRIYMHIVTPILCKLYKNVMQGIKISIERSLGSVF